MRKAVSRSFRKELNTVEPVFLDEGVQLEREHPVEQTVRW